MATEYGKNVWWNGKLLKIEDAKIGIATHSLHYGGAIFEGIRIYNGKPFLLKEHIDRLFQSAESMLYKMRYSKDELYNAIIELVDIEGLKNGYIRPLVWLGEEDMKIMGVDATLHTAIMICKILEKFDDYKFRLLVSKWRRAPSNCFPYTSKAAGLYMMYSLIKREAANAGFDDSLMLDEYGYIAECSTSNFFAISDNVLLTPRDKLILGGITRSKIIKIAKSLNIQCKEVDILLSELKNCNFAFLTGTAIELRGVKEIQDPESNSIYNFDEKNAIYDSLFAKYSEITQQ